MTKTGRCLSYLFSMGTALVITGLFAFPCTAVPYSEETGLWRRLDPVVITGAQCPDMLDDRIDQLRLFAFRQNEWNPVPFQIDEVDDKGNFVLHHGEEQGKDERPNRFDENDQLVFMARDAGERCPQTIKTPAGASKHLEIRLTDPVTGKRSWAYLMLFPETPPPLSTADYVDYHPAEKRITARNYTARFDERFPATAAGYTFSQVLGGRGKDIIDRVKAGLDFTFFIALHMDEEHIKVREAGYVDGPVRVIIRSTNTIKLVLGIPGPRTTGNTFFYDSFADFPFIVDFPVRPRKFRARVYDDFSDFEGWTFYNANNPEGHRIDGTMGPDDKDLDRSAWTWSAVSNGHQPFWSLSLIPRGCPVVPNLYFLDDRTKKDPLEDVQGELPGVGWDFKEGWNRVKSFPLEIRLIHFFTRGYRPGDEESVVAVFEHPLQARTDTGP